MPNYINKLYDPSQAQQQAVNNMLNVANMQETRKRNKLAERQDKRLQAEHDFKMLAIPFAWEQQKLGHIRDISKQLIGLPAEQRAARYKQVIQLAETPIADHPELGPLGVVNSAYFMDPKEFGELDQKQQLDYVKLLSYSADALASLDLESSKARNKATQIAAEHTAKLAQIKAKGSADIDLAQEKGKQDRLTEKTKQSTGNADKRQARVDKLQKEVARLAEVRQKIRKGDKMDQVMKLLSLSKNAGINMDENTGMEEALKKIDQYEKWLRKELRGLEKGSNAKDPLNLGL